MGCIFAELLQTLEPVSDDAVPPTRTLFPGESCYPLSSTSNEEEVDAELFNEELQAETHQLNKIFDHIGATPTQQTDESRGFLGHPLSVGVFVSQAHRTPRTSAASRAWS